jgi:hydrogenase-4 component B
MHLSVAFILIGFIWVYAETGSFDFKAIGIFFDGNSNFGLFLLFFAGFGFKAGFFGLHTWLPHAHPAAPSHVSGVMSGVIVKMGIYGILRIISYLKTDFIVLGEIVLSLALVTGLYGILNASVQRDFKKMLAYCTIENIGIIGVGIGLGLIGIGLDRFILVILGFGSALLHVLNHSLYKSLLFFSAGSVYQQTHTRDMDKLGGLVRKMPQTTILFLFGALAIGGIPPLNGFISEFIIYTGLLEGIQNGSIAQIMLFILSFGVLSLIGGISILTFTKTFGTLFLGSSRTKLKQPAVEVSFAMLSPQYLTLFVMLIIAFFPGYFLQLASGIINQQWFHLDSGAGLRMMGLANSLSKISLFSFLFVLAIVTGIIFRYFVNRKNGISAMATWGCAYPAPDSRMQYTAKSYSKTVSKLTNALLLEKKLYVELNRDEVFPVKRKYLSIYLDFVEYRIVDPLVYGIKQLMNLFKFIQNGRIQTYVLYGIVFILVIVIGTVLDSLF